MNALASFEREQQVLPDGRTIRVARAKPVASISVEVAYTTRRPRDSALIYAENRLYPWAKWAKENRDALGYPTISLLFKAMQITKIGIVRGAAYPVADEHCVVHYPINAEGRETRSLSPPATGEPPEAIAEVDMVVAKLPRDLHDVLIADFFTYGPIEVRCKVTRFRRARYSQLLEAAKYAVYAALSSRTDSMA